MARSLRALDVTHAAINALRGDASLTALTGEATTKAYTNVPEDVAAPYVEVQSGAESEWATETNDDDGSECELVVNVFSAYRGTLQLDQVANRVLQVLTTASTWAGLSGFAGWRFGGSPAPTDQQMVNGQVYRRRVLRLRVFLSA